MPVDARLHPGGRRVIPESSTRSGSYSEQDHATWATLLRAYESRLDAVACPEVVEGFQRLNLTERISSLAELSDRVERLCGWRVEPVDGLVSGAEFVAMLGRRSYPITVHMRPPEEIEFSALPDLFHDVVGHLPLLVHRPYTEFLERFAEVLATYSQSSAAATALGRFYWHTTDVGLASDVDRPRIFGAAILTSSAECDRATAPTTARVPFDLQAAGRATYDIHQVQERYFVTESLAELLGTGPRLDAWARQVATAGQVR